MAKTLWPAAAGNPQTVAWTASLAAALAVVLVAAAVAVSGAQPGGPLAGPADASTSASGADVIAFRHLTREQGLPNAVVNAVAQDALGFVWIGTADGLARYDGLDVRVFRHRADSSSVVGNEILALAAGAGGEMWVGTSDGLSRYDPAREAFETVAGLPDENVLAVAVDTAGVVWAGPDGGLARVVGAGFGGRHGLDAFHKIFVTEGLVEGDELNSARLLVLLVLAAQALAVRISDIHLLIRQAFQQADGAHGGVVGFAGAGRAVKDLVEGEI